MMVQDPYTGEWTDDGQPDPSAAPSGPPDGQHQFGTNPDGTPQYINNMPSAPPAGQDAQNGLWQLNQTPGDPNYLKYYWLPTQGQGATLDTQPGWSAGPRDQNAPPGGSWNNNPGGGVVWSPADTGGGGGGNGGGGGGSSTFTWPTYQQPSPYKFTPFSYDPYTQLSAADAANTPGYSFARDQGRDAILTNRAALGTARSGGTLKDLFAWGDQFASQNYQQAEAQHQNIYKTNRDNAFNNWAGNEAGGLATWQANNQPAQFGASQSQNQASLTFADLFNRYKSMLDSTTAIATMPV